MLGFVFRLRLMNRKDITFKRVFAAIIRRIVQFPSSIYFYFPFGFPAKNRKKLRALNNSHEGERCFILANGPSLNYVDFNLLKDEYCMGMNRIYLMKEQNGFMPNCLFCIDEDRLIKPFHKDLDKLDIPCFYSFSSHKYFSKKENQYFLGGSYNPIFCKDAADKFGYGGTVTYHVIQMAFCMGFKEVYIIGKDHSFNVSGKAGTAIEVKGNDQNHFIKDYFLPGQKFDIPDYQIEEYAYRIAREAYEQASRKIFNATHGGKLEIFERVDFNSLFHQK